MVLNKHHQTESDVLGFFPTLPEANSFFNLWISSVRGRKIYLTGLMAVTLFDLNFYTQGK